MRHPPARGVQHARATSARIAREGEFTLCALPSVGKRIAIKGRQLWVIENPMRPSIPGEERAAALDLKAVIRATCECILQGVHQHWVMPVKALGVLSVCWQHAMPSAHCEAGHEDLVRRHGCTLLDSSRPAPHFCSAIDAWTLHSTGTMRCSNGSSCRRPATCLQHLTKVRLKHLGF